MPCAAKFSDGKLDIGGFEKLSLIFDFIHIQISQNL